MAGVSCPSRVTTSWVHWPDVPAGRRSRPRRSTPCWPVLKGVPPGEEHALVGLVGAVRADEQDRRGVGRPDRSRTYPFYS